MKARVHKFRTEDFISFDVRAWSRLGKLLPGSSFQVFAGADCLRVDTESDGLNFLRQEKLVSRVLLVRTPCTLGGERVWFVCPNDSCNRRSAYLYLAGGTLACRRCLDLGYASQRKRAPQRDIEKARQLRRRIGGLDDLTQPLPQKPLGMHSRTYGALVEQAIEIENRIVGFEGRKIRASVRMEPPHAPSLAKDHVAEPKRQNNAAVLCQHLWRLAQFPPERTRGSISAQLRALDAIARLRGFIS